MRSLRAVAFAITVAISVSTSSAQEACPCIPISKIWVGAMCDSWNCAAAALITANGDPNVFVVPFGSDDKRWLVVRQVAAGSYSDESPFNVESFDGVADAAARFAAIASDFHPKMASSADGKFLVISLKQVEARHRSVGH
jgi:hypothetical protein